MAFNIDGVQTIEVKNIDSFMINQFSVSIDGKSLNILYSECSGGECISRKNITIIGDDFLSIVGSMPDSSKNFYDNIKGKLYEYLAAELELTGTVI